MKTVVNTMKAVKDSVFLKHIRVLDPAGPWDQRMDLMVHHGKLVYVAPSTSAGVSDLPECVAAAQLDPADVVAAEHLWAGLKSYVLEDVQSDDSVLVARMRDMFVEIGTSLADEPDLRRDINEGMERGKKLQAEG